MRGVRQACTRVARAGYEVEVRRVGDIDAASWRELRTRGGRPGAATPSSAASRWRCPGWATRPTGTASWRRPRRDGRAAGPAALRAVGPRRAVAGPHAPRPLGRQRAQRVHDRDAAAAMRRELGVTRVSLNFAVFRDAIERGERIGAGPVLRAWRGTAGLRRRGGGRSSRCTGSTPSSARTGSRGSSRSRPAATFRGSRWRPWRPRRSSSARTGSSDCSAAPETARLVRPDGRSRRAGAAL